MDIVGLAGKVEEALTRVRKPLKVAVMGCAVNGPGEARDADIGIACGRDRAVLFKRGRKIRIVEGADLVGELIREVEKMAEDYP
jgi:(E)-4-hydroxy-3-methylbut-2-enyl-diphosphate synthase